MANDETAYEEGPVGDLTPCFELCYGDGHDDPPSWLVAARVAFDGRRAVVEHIESPEITDAIRASAHRQIQYVFSSDYQGTDMIHWDANGQQRPRYARRIGMIASSTGNWYGDWHWRGSR